jgi:hypothetical protein
MAVLAIAAVCCRQSVLPATAATADGETAAVRGKAVGPQELLISTIANKLQVISHHANLLNEVLGLPVSLISPLLFDGPLIQRTFADLALGSDELHSLVSSSISESNAMAAGASARGIVDMKAADADEGQLRLMALWDLVSA